jgi:hypothetical protein
MWGPVYGYWMFRNERHLGWVKGNTQATRDVGENALKNYLIARRQHARFDETFPPNVTVPEVLRREQTPYNGLMIPGRDGPHSTSIAVIDDSSRNAKEFSSLSRQLQNRLLKDSKQMQQVFDSLRVAGIRVVRDNLNVDTLAKRIEIFSTAFINRRRVKAGDYCMTDANLQRYSYLEYRHYDQQVGKIVYICNFDSVLMFGVDLYTWKAQAEAGFSEDPEYVVNTNAVQRSIRVLPMVAMKRQVVLAARPSPTRLGESSSGQFYAMEVDLI